MADRPRSEDFPKAPDKYFDAPHYNPSGLDPRQKYKLYNSLDQALEKYLNLKLGSNDQNRLFYMNEDDQLVTLSMDDLISADGRDRLTELVMQNRLYAIPLGENSPVQIQYGKINDKEAGIDDKEETIHFNDNLDKEPKLGGWVSFWSTFGFYKAEVAKFKEDTKRWETVQRVKNARTQSGFKDTERESGKAARDEAKEHEKNLERGKEAIQAERDKEAAQKLLPAAEKEVKQFDISLDTIRSVYGAKPVLSELLKANNVCTKEQFDLLQSFEFGLEANGNERAENGGSLKLTEDDFVALAMSAAFRPEISGKIEVSSQPYSPEPTVQVGNISTMFTSDWGIVSGGKVGRQNHGVYIEPIIKPAREAAADAVRAYQQGNKAAVADLIAEGLAAYHFDISNQEAFSLNNISVTHFFGRLSDMMERDKELGELVKKSFENRKVQAKQEMEQKTAEQQEFKDKYGKDLENMYALHQVIAQNRTSKETLSKKASDIRNAYGRKSQAYQEAEALHDQYKDLLDERSELLKTEGKDSEAYQKCQSKIEELGVPDDRKLTEIKDTEGAKSPEYQDYANKLDFYKEAIDRDTTEFMRLKQEFCAARKEERVKEIMGEVPETAQKALQDYCKLYKKWEEINPASGETKEAINVLHTKKAEAWQKVEEQQKGLTEKEQKAAKEMLNEKIYLEYLARDAHYTAAIKNAENRSTVDMETCLKSLAINTEIADKTKKYCHAKETLLQSAANGTDLFPTIKENCTKDILALEIIKKDYKSNFEKVDKLVKGQNPELNNAASHIDCFSEQEDKYLSTMSVSNLGVINQFKNGMDQMSDIQKLQGSKEGREKFAGNVNELLEAGGKTELMRKNGKAIMDSINVASMTAKLANKKQAEKTMEERRNSVRSNARESVHEKQQGFVMGGNGK